MTSTDDYDPVAELEALAPKVLGKPLAECTLVEVARLFAAATTADAEAIDAGWRDLGRSANFATPAAADREAR